MGLFFLLIPIQFILYPNKCNYLIDLFQNKLNLDGFLNLTNLNLIISPKDVQDFSSKFSNNTATLREIFEIGPSSTKQTFNFDFLSQITNLSYPIASLITNKTASMIKSSLDDIIYFSETYTEFFKTINLSPIHWRSLFIMFKKDFESMTISRSLATIGIDIENILTKVNFILSSLSTRSNNDKITIETLHKRLNIEPTNSYIDLSSNFQQLINNSIIISPRFLSNFFASMSVYVYSLMKFTFGLCDSLISATFSYLINIFDFQDFPISERIAYFRRGVDKLRQAPDDSLFKRLILEKVEFLNELSFYMNNFLNNEFQMRDFFVNFLKIEKKKYEKGIHYVDNFLNNATIIDEFDKNSQIGKFLTNFVQNSTFLKKDVSLKFLFSSEESFNKSMKTIVDLSDENYEVQLFVKIQKSLQKILNDESNFEKEFNFDSEKIFSIVNDLKKSSFRQFLVNNGLSEISNKIENVGSFFAFLSNIQKKLFIQNYKQLFDRFGFIGNLLKNQETKASSLLDAIDDGLSIVIDVLFNFTSAVKDKKSPSEVIHSISTEFLDFEKTVNNIIHFDKNKRLSLKNFNDAISIKNDQKLKVKRFTFYDLVPLDDLINFLNKLASILNEKKDIKISDLRIENNELNNFFYDALNYAKKSLLMPIVDYIKILHKKYVKSNLDVDLTFEKLREFVKFTIDDRKVGIETFNKIFVTIPPFNNQKSEKGKFIQTILPAILLTILAVIIFIAIIIKVTCDTNSFTYQMDPVELDSKEFRDNDTLLNN